MLKRRIAIAAIILFAAPLFAWNARATEAVPNNPPAKRCIKVQDDSNTDQAVQASNKKPIKKKH